MDDIRYKPNKLCLQGDIIFLSGVHSHFDDPEIYLNGCIKRSNKSSKIIIHGIFNPYDIDILIKYKKSNDYDTVNKKINQTGWNMFSLKTIKRFLNKNKNIKNYKFRKLLFHKL